MSLDPSLFCVQLEATLKTLASFERFHAALRCRSGWTQTHTHTHTREVCVVREAHLNSFWKRLQAPPDRRCD